MEYIVIINQQLQFLGYNNLRAILEINPQFSFVYDTITLDTQKQKAEKTVEGYNSDLSKDEIEELTSFAKNYPYKVWELKNDGSCGEEGLIQEFGDNWAHCPPPKLPGNYYYNRETLNWDYIYGIDADGKYLGNVTFLEATSFATYPTSNDYDRWDAINKVWYDARTLEEFKVSKIESLDIVRNFAIDSGTLFNGIVWTSNEKAVQDLNEAPETTLIWKDIDSDDVELEGYTVVDIKNAVSEYIVEVNQRYDLAVSKVNEATTKEEIFMVDFNEYVS